MKQMQKVIGGGLGAGLLLPGLALAQINQTTIQRTALGIDTTRGLLPLIASIINLVLLIGGIAALAYLIYGGFLYITAGGDSEAAGKGRTAITNAIIGIILIFVAYAILQFVSTGV